MELVSPIKAQSIFWDGGLHESSKILKERRADTFSGYFLWLVKYIIAFISAENKGLSGRVFAACRKCESRNGRDERFSFQRAKRPVHLARTARMNDLMTCLNINKNS
jgi:hypothetical protein